MIVCPSSKQKRCLPIDLLFKNQNHNSMKLSFLIIALIISLSSFADDYSKGSVQYLDGKSKTGLLENTMGDVILFKVSDNAAVEKIQSSLLRSVTYFGKDGNELTFFYLKIYLGWGQTRL